MYALGRDEDVGVLIGGRATSCFVVHVNTRTGDYAACAREYWDEYAVRLDAQCSES